MKNRSLNRQKRICLSILAAAGVIAALAVPPQASAASCTWNPATGNWGTAGDWSCGVVPGSTDTANIGASKVVTITSGQSILTLGNSGGVNIDAFGLNLAGGGSTVNTGTINVGGASTAHLGVSAGHNVNNTGGVINVGNGSVVNQFSSTITGGTINTTGTGALVAFNSSSNFLSGVTLNGNLDLATGTGIERVSGGLTLNGAININNNSTLAFQGNQTVGGTGTITLGSTGGSNRVNVEAGNLVLGSGITLHGQNGTIGNQSFIGGAATLTNNGVISADISGGTITLGVQGLTTNNATLSAQNGGTLQLNSAVINAGSGHIDAIGAGSQVVQNGVTITGGTLNTSGGGVLVAVNSSNNFLNGTTLNGVIDLASNTGIERLGGTGLTMVTGSAININNNSILTLEGSAGLSGTGAIVLGATGGSNRINLENTGTSTIGTGILIHGQNGTIGQQAFVGGAPHDLVNNGTISTDVAGGTINLTPNGGTTNNGTLSAQSGGTLLLSTNVVGNVGSQIVAGAGSAVVQNGVTISGVINTSGTGSFNATNSSGNFLNGVTLNGTLDLATATGIERVINDLTLNGAININNNSTLDFQGNNTVSGTGSITLGATGGGIGIDGANAILTLGANTLIHGQNGTIGGQPFVGGGNNALVNNGTIAADVSGGTINIALNSSAATAVTNNGTLEAQNGGTLRLSSNVTGNIGSQIIAGAGSAVVQNGVTLSGVINTSGTGSFNATNNGNNFLSGVTLGGTLDLATAQGTERVTGGLTMQSGSAININNNSTLAFQGNQTVGGTGTITLGSTGSGNHVNLEAGNLVLGSGITLHGQNGTIGNQSFISGAATLTNNGTISADVSGGTVNLAVNGLTTNNGTLAAQNGGTLLLSSNVAGSVTGQIAAGAGSLVLQNGVTLSGVINTSGTGRFAASNSGGNFLSGVTLGGTLDLATATGIEQVTGGLTLNGAINVNNNSILAFEGNQTVGGTGTITLGSTGGSNRVNVEAGNLVLGSGITLHGQNGTIGNQSFISGAATLTNNGTISADVSGGTVNLAVNGLTTNNGTLAAQNGGTLQLSSAVTNAGSGHIDATGAGSRVVQNGTTITGGTINTTGGGVLAPTNNGNNFLNGVTVNGTIDLATAAAIERIGGGTTINTGGAFNINNNSILSFQGTQSIGTTGIGNIVLGNTGSSNRIAIEGGTTLTVDAGVIIHGQNGTIGSQIFAGGAADLINNGTIATDVSGGLITIAPNGNFTNNGTLRATNGGTLTVSPAVAFTNLSGTTLSGGTYEVIAGGGTSNLRLPNANIVTNAATILLDGANSNLLNNNTSGNALANLATNATTTTPGSFTIQNGRNFTTAGAFINNALGVVTVGNSSTFNSTGAFTNSGTLAMRGGTFDAPTSLISSGVVNGSGIVNPNIQNTGTVQAFGGTLTATNGITGTTGMVQSDAGGTLAIGAASTAGTLTNNGNLALGANNITVSNAYNNANFGSGNSFNNRANVTGTGQILAAGLSPSTAQTLSGNIVPTPTSGNATMNFGNIHVGSSSTLNYQIGNANTGGPDLLGAIQTTVNGGNITDARLSGAGVTASNWGPVAAGGNTGNLGVTFNATSGGALTGQQVHIRNNFDNTNAQNLTINGAAYNLAAGNTTPSPVVFGNAHVGDVLTQGLTVSNTAPAGAFTEGLNASFGSNTGNAGNNAGSVSLLAGGASNNTNLSATLDTTAAGARSGTVTVNYVSDGTGTSGLGTTNVGSQTINVSGNVYRLAQANSIAPINFGNVLVGSSQTQTVSISNLATADSFSEALNAAFGTIGGTNPSQFSAAGFINQLAAGANDNASMVITLNTSSAGAYSANVQVLLNSDGTGTSGLGITALPTQVINLDGLVTGTVGNLAQAGPHSPEPVNFGNVRVGTVVPTQALSISNIASGPAEGLNGSISTGSAGITASGAFSNLAAGATDNSSLLVGINTATAGSRNGTATIALASDGTFNGGTQTTLSSQTVNVQGGVFQVAQPAVPANVNLGNVRIGGSPSQAISIGNTDISPAGFQEGLNASVGGTSGGATGAGSITNLAAGSTSNAINVGLNVGAAGVQSGAVTLNLASNGTVSGLSDLALANANVNVQATGYRLADPVINTGSITLAARVGDASPSAGISVANSSPDIFTEGLNVTRGSTTPAGFTSSGSISNLAAGTTDSSAIQVALNTSTAGTFTGTQALNFVSTGAGTTGAADVSVGSGNVNLNGKVYTPAQASVGTTSINFGIVHVGDVVAAQTVSLANSAPVTALNDTLSGSLGGASAPFSASGNVSGLTAGGPADNTSLQVGLNTSTAGIFVDNGTLTLASHNPDMPDLALADVTIDLNAQVNNYADAALRKNSGGGSFTGGGNLFVLNFGTVSFGSSAITSILEAFNSAFGPADLLDGIFNFLDSPDFMYSGFGPFNNLAAGQGNGGMNVSFNPTALGSFSDDIQFASLGHNASGYSDALPDILLRVQGNVVAGGTVPEPGTWALMAIALIALAAVRRRAVSRR